MIIGYARVSSENQNLNLQIDALKDFGCEKIYEEKISSGKVRPELQKALNFLRENDVFVVYKLDRLGRSLSDLLSIINQLKVKNVSFIALEDKINTDYFVNYHKYCQYYFEDQ